LKPAASAAASADSPKHAIFFTVVLLGVGKNIGLPGV